jgi:Domain of unknown function (DUF4062)
MAHFSARDSEAAEYCQARVRGCDVYVGIGLRYGTPARDEPEVSYAELEFDTATRVRLPQPVFLLDEAAAVPIPPERLIGAAADKQASPYSPALSWWYGGCAVRWLGHGARRGLVWGG